LWSWGLALQLRQDLLNSGGWTTTFSWLPHCVPHAFVALFDGLRWRHLLHIRETTHQQAYSYNGYSTTLLKTTYLLRCGQGRLYNLKGPWASKKKEPVEIS
jgi:hypothetical protein